MRSVPERPTWAARYRSTWVLSRNPTCPPPAAVRSVGRRSFGQRGPNLVKAVSRSACSYSRRRSCSQSAIRSQFLRVTGVDLQERPTALRHLRVLDLSPKPLHARSYGGRSRRSRLTRFPREEHPHTVPGKVLGNAAVGNLDTAIDIAACPSGRHFTRVPPGNVGPEVSAEPTKPGEPWGPYRGFHLTVPNRVRGSPALSTAAEAPGWGRAEHDRRTTRGRNSPAQRRVR